VPSWCGCLCGPPAEGPDVVFHPRRLKIGLSGSFVFRIPVPATSHHGASGWFTRPACRARQCRMEPCGSPAPSDPLPVREDRPEAYPNASMDAACRRSQLGPGAGAVVYPLVSAPIGRRPPRKRTRDCRGSRRGRRPPRCLARSIRREATELSGAASLETRSMLLYASTYLSRSSAGPRLESAHSVRVARSRGSEPMRQVLYSEGSGGCGHTVAAVSEADPHR
jgi:hypothetical protein